MILKHKQKSSVKKSIVQPSSRAMEVFDEHANFASIIEESLIRSQEVGQIQKKLRRKASLYRI
ncbi:hypothetical protein, partial [Bifidobacterium aquikefiri]